MKCFLVFALTATTGLTLIPPGAEAGPRMTEYMCEPLNSMNFERCCNAINWREIIPLGKQRLCLDARDEGAAPRGGLATLGGGEEGDDDDDDDDDDDSRANPGNDKPVGHAGEKEDQGMWDSGRQVGVRGLSDNLSIQKPSPK